MSYFMELMEMFRRIEDEVLEFWTGVLVHALLIFQLLNSSTIPMVLLLSWLFLFTRYLWTHITGVGICLIGFAVIIWADAQGRKDGSEGKFALGILRLKIRPISFKWLPYSRICLILINTLLIVVTSYFSCLYRFAWEWKIKHFWWNGRR